MASSSVTQTFTPAVLSSPRQYARDAWGIPVEFPAGRNESARGPAGRGMCCVACATGP